MRQIELVERDVEDPWRDPAQGRNGKAGTVTVMVNLRESSIAHMHARGQIDDAQKQAADRFRGLYERASLGGLQTLDIGRERVDNGAGQLGPSDGRLDAARELSVLARDLGKIGYPVCVGICAEHMSIRELAWRMLGRKPVKRELDYYGRLLRDHLDLLCAMWGYKSQ